MRGDCIRRVTVSNVHGFDPRPRMRGDRLNLGDQLFGQVFRSTPPHEGRPLNAFIASGTAVGDVSIHAPARGATAIPSTPTSPTAFRSTPPHEGRRALHRDL